MASPRERADRASELAVWRGPDRRVSPRPADVRPVYHPGHSDPRVTTRPSDVRLHDPYPVHRPRRHHFHDVAPWPHRHHHDYVYVDRGGWWPRWYPYWDPSWYAYWWQLYDYYGGDAYPDYAEYARDAVLRQYAPQWGLRVGGDYDDTQVGIDYSDEQVGIEAYGVSPLYATRRQLPNSTQSFREAAFQVARRSYVSPKGQVMVYVGFRVTPWGSETTFFGTPEGLQRWANEQARDTGIYYAAAFDLTRSASPVSEVAR